MEVKGLWEIISPRLRDQVTNGVIEVEQIAVFCKANPITVRSWLKGNHPPNGDKLLRLWHILALGGPAPELENLPALNRILSELYAFDVLDIREVQTYAGMNSAHISNAYASLRGQPLLRWSIEPAELEAEYGDKLRAAKQAVNVQTAPSVVTDEEVPVPAATPFQAAQPAPEPIPDEIPVPTEPAPTSASVTNVLSADPKLLLASLLGASAPLAKVLLSNATTAEERSEFRDLISTEVLFELSNTLGALCSERARGLAR